MRTYRASILLLGLAAVGFAGAPNPPLGGATLAKSDEWRVIGPWAGDVEFVASAPSDRTTVYASSERGGVFVSRDSGSSWQAVNTGLSDLRITCLAVSPADPGVVYAGGVAGGFKTIDAGASWAPLGNGFPADFISSIVVDPTNTAVVYAAGTGTLVKSANAGAAWSLIGNDEMRAAQPRVLAIDPAHTATVYLGTFGGGVFKSQDAGSSWDESSSGLKDDLDNFVGINTLAIDPTNRSRLVIGTPNAGVYVSTDSGSSWVPPSDFIGFTVRDLVFETDGTSYVATLHGVFKAPRGSAAATDLVGIPSTFASANSLALGPGSGSALYVGFGNSPAEPGGFARLDGNSFRVSRFPLAVVTSIAADPYAPGRFLAATTLSAYEYAPGSGDTWRALDLRGSSAQFAPHTIFFDARTPGAVYAGSVGPISKSNDGGRTVANAAYGGDPNVVTLVRSFVAQPSSVESVYVGTSQGLFLSTDAGGSWAPGSADLSGRDVLALAAEAGSSSTLWAGTDDGLYRSTDAGAHWQRVGTSVDGTVNAILSAASGRLVAGTESGLLVSADGGGTWTAGADIHTTVNALAENPASGMLAAGTLAGVFVSVDGGATWAAANEALTNLDVRCLTFLSASTLLAGTNGGSVFALTRTSERAPVSRTRGGFTPRGLSPRP